MKYIVEHFSTVVLKMLINVSIQLTFKWNIHTTLPYDITVNGRILKMHWSKENLLLSPFELEHIIE